MYNDAEAEIYRLEEENKRLRGIVDAACAVVGLPGTDNDGGPGDIAEELRVLQHNLNSEYERGQREAIKRRPLTPDEAVAFRLKVAPLIGKLDAAEKVVEAARELLCTVQTQWLESPVGTNLREALAEYGKLKEEK